MATDAYLKRIGASRPAAPDLAALRDLHERHLHTVPFENLGIYLDQPIDLDEAALLDKIVRRRRGGFCYELNGLFAALLRELGFTVRLLSARAARKDGTFTFPFDHLVLRVELDEPWLADVGWGPGWPRHPVRLDIAGPQPDSGAELSVADLGGDELELRRDGKPVYRVETRDREMADFEPACWWQQTHPDSPFRKGPTCSIPTENGRVTLADNKLIETEGDERTERVLDSDEETLTAYRERFGIELDRVPRAVGRRERVIGGVECW